MTTLREQIMTYFRSQDEGTPVSAKQLLHLGSRSGVDRALAQLVRGGRLLRASRGLYIRVMEGRFGLRAPRPQKVVEALAKRLGEVVAPDGAAAANALGLTTQVPTRMIWWTSGRDRRLKLGKQTVDLVRVPLWQLQNAERVSGQIIRALAWAGPQDVRMVLRGMKGRLSAHVRRELIASRAVLPRWLVNSIEAELGDPA